MEDEMPCSILRAAGVMAVLLLPGISSLADTRSEHGVGDVLPGNTEVIAENFVVTLPSGPKWIFDKMSPKDGGIQRIFRRSESSPFASSGVMLSSMPMPPAIRARMRSKRQELCIDRVPPEGMQTQQCETMFLRSVLKGVFNHQKKKQPKIRD
jgi:hypothetical protein